MATKDPLLSNDSDKVPEKVAEMTNNEAVFNLLNNCLGTGVLTVSFSFTYVGVFGGWIGLMLSAVLNRLTLLKVVKACYIGNTNLVIAELGQSLFGAAGRFAVIFSYASLCLGVIIAYTTASKSFISELLILVGINMAPNDAVPVAAVFVMLAPLTLLRSMRKVAVVSFLAFCGAIFAVIAIVGAVGRDELNGTVGEGIKYFPDSMQDVYTAMPLLVLVMSAQSGGPNIFATIQDKSEANREAVSLQMYVLVFTMNILLATSVYIHYGSLTPHNVLDRFKPSDPPAIVARVGMLVLAGLSYVFIVFPCRCALIDMFFQKDENKQEASIAQFLSVTLLINVFCQSVSYFIPDIAFIVGLTGAFSSNMIGFIMPPLFYIMVHANPQDGKTEPTPMFSVSNVGYWLLFLFGCSSLVLSMYSTLSA